MTRGETEKTLTKRSVSVEQAIKMLEIAQQKSTRDFLIYRLMAANGFQVGEVVGAPTRVRTEGKWTPRDPSTEGLQIRDLRKDGIWIRFKGKPSRFKRVKPEVIQAIKNFIGSRTDGEIFDLTPSGLEVNTRCMRESLTPAGK